MFNPSCLISASEIANELNKELSRNFDISVLNQLNWFIKRNILVVKTTNPLLVQNPATDSIEVRTFVELELKDKEYIEKIEKENNELKEKMKHLEMMFRKI